MQWSDVGQWASTTFRMWNCDWHTFVGWKGLHPQYYYRFYTGRSYQEMETVHEFWF